MANRTGVIHLLFGFNGRIGRAKYWLGQLLQWAFLIVALLAASLILGESTAAQTETAATMTTAVVVVVIVILLIWQLALTVKRAHDRDRSTTWGVILLLLALVVPFLGLWLLIDLGFLRGRIGPNKYGPDPLAERDIREASEAIASNPNNARAYLSRGSTYAFSHDFDRAMQDFDKAISLNSNDYEAFNNRAYVSFMRGQFDRALADYDTSLKLEPKNAEALFGRGTIKLRMSDPAGEADIAAAKVLRRTITEDMAVVGIR